MNTQSAWCAIQDCSFINKKENKRVPSLMMQPCISDYHWVNQYLLHIHTRSKHNHKNVSPTKNISMKVMRHTGDKLKQVRFWEKYWSTARKRRGASYIARAKMWMKYRNWPRQCASVYRLNGIRAFTMMLPAARMTIDIKKKNKNRPKKIVNANMFVYDKFHVTSKCKNKADE